MQGSSHSPPSPSPRRSPSSTSSPSSSPSPSPRRTRSRSNSSKSILNSNIHNNNSLSPNNNSASSSSSTSSPSTSLRSPGHSPSPSPRRVLSPRASPRASPRPTSASTTPPSSSPPSSPSSSRQQQQHVSSSSTATIPTPATATLNSSATATTTPEQLPSSSTSSLSSSTSGSRPSPRSTSERTTSRSPRSRSSTTPPNRAASLSDINRSRRISAPLPENEEGEEREGEDDEVEEGVEVEGDGKKKKRRGRKEEKQHDESDKTQHRRSPSSTSSLSLATTEPTSASISRLSLTGLNASSSSSSSPDSSSPKPVSPKSPPTEHVTKFASVLNSLTSFSGSLSLRNRRSRPAIAHSSSASTLPSPLTSSSLLLSTNTLPTSSSSPSSLNTSSGSTTLLPNSSNNSNSSNSNSSAGESSSVTFAPSSSSSSTPTHHHPHHSIRFSIGPLDRFHPPPSSFDESGFNSSSNIPSWPTTPSSSSAIQPLTPSSPAVLRLRLSERMVSSTEEDGKAIMQRLRFSNEEVRREFALALIRIFAVGDKGIESSLNASDGTSSSSTNTSPNMSASTLTSTSNSVPTIQAGTENSTTNTASTKGTGSVIMPAISTSTKGTGSLIMSSTSTSTKGTGSVITPSTPTSTKGTGSVITPSTPTSTSTSTNNGSTSNNSVWNESAGAGGAPKSSAMSMSMSTSTSTTGMPLMNFLSMHRNPSSLDGWAAQGWEALENERQLVSFICYAITQEISGTEQESLLFREGSLMVDLLSEFIKFAGQKQLASLKRLVAKTKRKGLATEIDPSRVLEEKRHMLEANRINLMYLTDKYLNTSLNAMNSCSSSLRAVLRHLYNEVEMKFPGSGSRVVGSLVYLRFFCPAIVSPCQYSLLEEEPSPELQRSHMLVAKLLQALANEATFDKEPYMACLETFIKEHTLTMKKAFADWTAEETCYVPLSWAKKNKSVEADIKLLQQVIRQQKDECVATSGLIDVVNEIKPTQKEKNGVVNYLSGSWSVLKRKKKEKAEKRKSDKLEREKIEKEKEKEKEMEREREREREKEKEKEKEEDEKEKEKKKRSPKQKLRKTKSNEQEQETEQEKEKEKEKAKASTKKMENENGNEKENENGKQVEPKPERRRKTREKRKGSLEDTLASKKKNRDKATTKLEKNDRNNRTKNEARARSFSVSEVPSRLLRPEDRSGVSGSRIGRSASGKSGSGGSGGDASKGSEDRSSDGELSSSGEVRSRSTSTCVLYQGVSKDIKEWSIHEVLAWLRQIPLRGDRNAAEYSELFIAKCIDGKKLLRQTQTSLLRMGITRMADRKTIASQVNLLLLQRAHGCYVRDIREWNVEDVKVWLGFLKFDDHYQRLCKANRITGQSLLGVQTVEGVVALGFERNDAERLLFHVSEVSQPIEIRFRRKPDMMKWSLGDVCEWLRMIEMGTYVAVFLRDGINGSSLNSLNETSLKEMGVSSIGHRKQILRNLRTHQTQSLSTSTSTLGLTSSTSTISATTVAMTTSTSGGSLRSTATSSIPTVTLTPASTSSMDAVTSVEKPAALEAENQALPCVPALPSIAEE